MAWLVPPPRCVASMIELKSAAGTRGTILIVGESGTGKELVARAIHECGPAATARVRRAQSGSRPYPRTSSRASSLDTKGAFSGANADYLGLFRAAEGGTLFLDEVTEMAPETQSKLLARRAGADGAAGGLDREMRKCAPDRIDQSRSPRKLSSRQAAPGPLLSTAGWRPSVPPLRERSDDVPPWSSTSLSSSTRSTSANSGARASRKGRSAAMLGYSWPGNVRELSNSIEGAFTFGRSPMIRLQDLPSGIAGIRSDKPSFLSPGPRRSLNHRSALLPRQSAN